MSATRVARAATEAADAALMTFPRSARLRLIAEGGHILFSLDPLPVVARVGLSDEGFEPEAAARALRLARALEPAPAIPLPDRPTVTQGAVVTFHPLIAGRRPGPSGADLNATIAALKALHQLLIPHAPNLRPFTDEIERLSRATTGAGFRAAVLMAEIDADVRRLSGDSPRLIPMHGDANPGNVIIMPSGGAVWIDFECVCLAPVEWDVALLPYAAARTFDVNPRRLNLCRVLRDRMYRAWSLVHPLRKHEADESDGADARPQIL